MRILLTGASGFIGSAVLARLQGEGHDVVPVYRRPRTAATTGGPYVILDLAQAGEPEAWLPHLTGIDAVVNCAGVLQDSPYERTADVHAKGPAALFAACEQAGVRRVIHFSAIGVDRATPSAFSQSKAMGDEDLSKRNLDWIILRPSVVVGTSAYGGSALFRGLAALPILPLARDTGLLQVVQLDDVVETVVRLLKPDAPARLALELCGPERIPFADVVARYRRWLGWRPAWRFTAPDWMMALAYRFGDFAGWLGWRPAIRTTARQEIVRGAVGDPSAWVAATGIEPQSFDRALALRPASVQEKWFAALYLQKAVIFTIFALFWLTTAFVSLGPGWHIGMDLMAEGGVTGPLAAAAVIGGAGADFFIGLGIAMRRTARPALWAALAISFVYVVLGTFLVPRLWIDPIGPMLKIWPVVALNLVALAIVDDR